MDDFSSQLHKLFVKCQYNDNNFASWFPAFFLGYLRAMDIHRKDGIIHKSIIRRNDRHKYFVNCQLVWQLHSHIPSASISSDTSKDQVMVKEGNQGPGAHLWVSYLDPFWGCREGWLARKLTWADLAAYIWLYASPSNCLTHTYMKTQVTCAPASLYLLFLIASCFAQT